MPSHTDLGPLISSHRGRPLRWRDLYTIFLPGTLAVFAPLGYGIYRAAYGYTHFGPATAEAWSRAWLLLAVVATLVLLLLALVRLYFAHRFFAIHENGLQLHLSPFRDHKFLWSQISGIALNTVQDRFLGIPLHTKHEAVIYPTLGKPIHLYGSLGDIQIITEHVQAHIYEYLRPRSIGDFQSGKWVYFGELAINQNGLKAKSKAYRWDHITHIFVESGHLVVKSGQFGSMIIPVSEIPNLDLLFELIGSQRLTPDLYTGGNK